MNSRVVFLYIEPLIFQDCLLTSLLGNFILSTLHNQVQIQIHRLPAE